MIGAHLCYCGLWIFDSGLCCDHCGACEDEMFVGLDPFIAEVYGDDEADEMVLCWNCFDDRKSEV